MEIRKSTQNRQHGMAQTLHFVAAEAESGQDERRHETQIPWMELEVPLCKPLVSKEPGVHWP